MNHKMKNINVSIIAGPCSVDEENLHEIFKISEIEVDGKRAIAGTRVVGLKSRSEFNSEGIGLGMDSEVVIENMKILREGGSVEDLKIAPSVEIAQEIFEKTNMLIATEIMVPSVQMY